MNFSVHRFWPVLGIVWVVAGGSAAVGQDTPSSAPNEYGQRLLTGRPDENLGLSETSSMVNAGVARAMATADEFFTRNEITEEDTDVPFPRREVQIAVIESFFEEFNEALVLLINTLRAQRGLPPIAAPDAPADGGDDDAGSEDGTDSNGTEDESASDETTDDAPTTSAEDSMREDASTKGTSRRVRDR